MEDNTGKGHKHKTQLSWHCEVIGVFHLTRRERTRGGRRWLESELLLCKRGGVAKVEEKGK